MMKSYSRPCIEMADGLSEGVFLASGNMNCNSQYMNGQYQQGTYNSITDGYKDGRGCEGCPAQNGTSCRFQSAPQEMEHWSGNSDFRPSWEVQGHMPDEKGY